MIVPLAQFLTRTRDGVCETVQKPYARSRVKYSSSVWNVPGTLSRVLNHTTVVSKSVNQDASVPTDRCWIRGQTDVSHWSIVPVIEAAYPLTRAFYNMIGAFNLSLIALIRFHDTFRLHNFIYHVMGYACIQHYHACNQKLFYTIGFVHRYL